MTEAPQVTVHVDQGRIHSAARDPRLRERMLVEAIQAALPNATAIGVDSRHPAIDRTRDSVPGMGQAAMNRTAL
jgi:hypothetical protein